MICTLMRYTSLLSIHALLLFYAHASIVFAHELDKGDVKNIAVSGTVSMITTHDRNMSISSGSEGLLIIQDQSTPVSGAVSDFLELLGKNSPAFIIDTHFYGNYREASEHFGAVGTIIAHKKIKDKTDVNQTPRSSSPIIAYEKELNVYFNDETISIMHLSAGHSAGDSIVLFETSNVAYLGHQFWNRRFPHIDLDRGESVKAYTLSVAECLSLVDASMKIIPGHGPLATRADLENFYKMLNMTSILVKDQMSKGLSVEDIVENGLGEAWRSWGDGQIDEKSWIRTLYTSLLDEDAEVAKSR